MFHEVSVLEAIVFSCHVQLCVDCSVFIRVTRVFVVFFVAHCRGFIFCVDCVPLDCAIAHFFRSSRSALRACTSSIVLLVQH